MLLDGKYDEQDLDHIVFFVDHLQCESRKDNSMIKYVVEIKQNKYGLNDNAERFVVPDNLLGFYIMEYSNDEMYFTLDDAIKNHSWLKCEKREVTTVEWVEL